MDRQRLVKQVLGREEEKSMRLKEHPRIQWPPDWSEWGTMAPPGEQGILKDIDLIDGKQLLLGNEFEGKVHFAELSCPNAAFANKLYERIKTLSGRPIKDIGELEINL
jgi:hypothetical protein